MTPDHDALIGRALDAGIGAEEVRLWKHGADRRERAESGLVSTLRTIEFHHLRVQYRLVAAMLAVSMLADLVNPIIALLGVEGGVTYRAAAATMLGPAALAHIFAALGVMLLPFLALQCRIGLAHRRGIKKLAVLSLTLQALVWAFLAWRCVPLDLGWAPVIFARNGLGALLFAFALAWSLNAEQLRAVLERAP